MSNAEVAAASRSQYVDFWNEVLVPKFVRWRHILVGGLTLHSAKVFPSLAVLYSVPNFISVIVLVWLMSVSRRV